MNTHRNSEFFIKLLRNNTNIGSGHLPNLNFPSNSSSPAQKLKIQKPGSPSSLIQPSVMHHSPTSKLDLSKSHLYTFAPQTLILSNITNLDLRFNKLTSLPALTLPWINNLSILRLDHNHFSKFPTSVYALSSLQTLTLNGNNICHIPAGLSCLKSLETLHLLNNQLRSITKEIREIKEIKDLRCDWFDYFGPHFKDGTIHK